MKSFILLIVGLSVLSFLVAGTSFAEPCNRGLIRAMREEGLTNEQIRLICEKAKLYDGVKIEKPYVIGQLEKSDMNRLRKDLLKAMQQVTINPRKEAKRISDIYKLLQCEKTNVLVKGKQLYQIEFKGSVQLLETVFDYKTHGKRTYRVPSNDIVAQFYRGKVDKGTIIPFTGRALYELTENGWKHKMHIISMKNISSPWF